MKRHLHLSIIILTVILFFSSCNSNNEKGVKYSFRDFIHKLNIIDLPFKHRPENIIEGTLKRIDLVDTIFTKDQLSMYYGLLTDTSKFFSVITFLPGDEYVPVLTTYDKLGNIIDSKSILVNGCGGGPCIDYCSSTSIIEKDFSIFCSDTIIGPTCDSLDNRIAGTDSIYTSYFKGKITNTGKIEFEDEKHIIIKK